jgi:hypothetical protein
MNREYRFEWSVAKVQIEYAKRDEISSGILNVNLGFGEVRHYGENHTPMAENGMVHASFEYNPNPDPNGAGCAIHGHMLKGAKWRISAIAPKSRSVVAIDGKIDQYVKTDHIIKYMMSLYEFIVLEKPHKGDPVAAMWDQSKIGW